MGYKVGTDFEVNDGGVSETRGLSHATRFNTLSFPVNAVLNLTKNDHLSIVRVTVTNSYTVNLPDSTTDNVDDGQEIIVRVLDVQSGGSVRVQCSVGGIRQIGTTTVTTGAITLSANQCYHYVYSSTLGYWLQIK